MSFWSSLLYARVAPAPVVTVNSISRFVTELARTKAVEEGRQLLCQIKYGERVDADEETTETVQWDPSGVIGVVGEYPWDRSESFSSLPALADALRGNERLVYRAFLDLGQLTSDVVAELTRKPSEENDQGLCLWAPSLKVGPVLVSGLDSEEPAFAGWMDFTFSGPRYFYPWTYREARERAEANEVVQQVAAICRETWPVEPAAPSLEGIEGRKMLEELWLYDDFAMPYDWLWFASESG